MNSPLRDKALQTVKKFVSPEMRKWVVSQQRKYRIQWPRMGNVNFGDLRRVTPISPIFGIDRGMPIDRYYIEKFLQQNAADIRGRCLELGDPYYINKFGGSRVEKADVLHVVAGNPIATIIADLTNADHVESNLFDCIIFTQSIQMIFDMPAALRTLHRILKPGGVLLLTTAGIAKIGRRLGRDDWGEYWHLTTQSTEALLKTAFPGGQIRVESHGNVLAAASYLYGLATEELSQAELDHVDPDIEIIVTGWAKKA